LFVKRSGVGRDGRARRDARVYGGAGTLTAPRSQAHKWQNERTLAGAAHSESHQCDVTNHGSRLFVAVPPHQETASGSSTADIISARSRPGARSHDSPP
jgi:hypothetical protein